MSPPADVSHEYLRNAVMTATPEQLQLMLYDGAIRYTRAGRAGIENDDREAAFLGFERAQRIVLEMMAGVDRNANSAIANQMIALYDFIYRRLIDANMQQDLQAADDALRILEHQRETWVLLIEKLQRENGSGDSPAGDVAEVSDTPEGGSFSAEG